MRVNYKLAVLISKFVLLMHFDWIPGSSALNIQSWPPSCSAWQPAVARWHRFESLLDALSLFFQSHIYIIFLDQVKVWLSGLEHVYWLSLATSPPNTPPLSYTLEHNRDMPMVGRDPPRMMYPLSQYPPTHGKWLRCLPCHF